MHFDVQSGYHRFMSRRSGAAAARNWGDLDMSYTGGIGAAARWLKSCEPASSTRTVLGAAAMALWIAQPAGVQALTPQQQLALDVYRELIETNTVTCSG